MIRSCCARNLLRGGLWPLLLILFSLTARSLSAVPVEKSLQSGWEREKKTHQSASQWVRSPQGAVRLISTVTGVGIGQSIRLGLQFHLQPHWKIYWRTPGDAGYPPTIDWNGSKNLAEISIAWPAPRRFSLQGIETAGYEGEIVLPLTATLEQPGVPFNGHAIVDFLTCSDYLCVPHRAELTLLILEGPAEVSPFMHLVERHAARVPGDGKEVGILVKTVFTYHRAKESFLEAHVFGAFPFRAPDLFIEGHGNNAIYAGTPEITKRSRDGRHVVMRALTRNPVAVGALATLTIVDGIRTMEATLPLSAPLSAPATVSADSADTTAVAVILGIAFLGGFILNLMPCVLPVLSLKVITLLAGHVSTEKRAVRWSFIASAAGVVCSFLLLAFTTITLRATGIAVGWGLHFQQPLFLSFMVVVLTFFTANLWGLFEISPPSWLTWLTNRGSGVCTEGYTGAFLTGVFATLLATPCSAPFLGTALGFALARGPSEIFLIFTMLGLGMAMPYILLAIFPILAARLPRPGPWIVHLKKILGFILLLTVMWLLSILLIQSGLLTFLLSIILIILIFIIFFLKEKIKYYAFMILCITMLLLSGSTLITHLDDSAWPKRETFPHNGPWIPFDANALAHHVSHGQVVFVDVTADWCITCQINKALVLSHREVRRRLKHDVVAMQADWTKPDVLISAYLAGFGRYGIPFNIVYGPGAPQGIPLPELLTVEGVIKALDVAAAGPR